MDDSEQERVRQLLSTLDSVARLCGRTAAALAATLADCPGEVEHREARSRLAGDAQKASRAALARANQLWPDLRLDRRRLKGGPLPDDVAQDRRGREG